MTMLVGVGIVGGLLLGVALATTPSSVEVGSVLGLGLLGGLVAAGLHLGVELATRGGRAAAWVAASTGAAVVGWHVREHVRPAGTVPSLDDPVALTWFLVVAAVAGVIYAEVVWRRPLWLDARRLTVVGLATVSLLVIGLLLSSTLDTFRWHLLRHHRLLGTVAAHLLRIDVPTVKVELRGRPGAVPTPVRPLEVTEPVDPRPSVLLVVVDALRGDAVRPGEKRTSFADALLAESVLFTDVRANSSWTLPSMGSLLTGRLPEEHGATRGFRLADGQETLAERLQARGYRTGAFVANTAVVTPGRGFAQGFDRFEALREAGRPYASAEVVTAAALAWLEEAPSDDAAPGPELLYVHYLDPHTPYLRGDALNPASHVRAVEEYDRELDYLDPHLTRLVGHVQDRWGPSAIVILTSDHGEEFGEHGERGHGYSLYDEVLDIPLVVRTPSGTPGTADAPLEGRDLFDLVLDLTQAPEMDLRAWASRRARATRYASVYSGRFSTVDRWLRPRRYEVAMRAIDHEGHRLIWSGFGDTLELYDVREDPAELVNLAGREPARLERLQARLRVTAPAWSDAPVHRLTPEILERLRALGYVR